MAHDSYQSLETRTRSSSLRLDSPTSIATTGRPRCLAMCFPPNLAQLCHIYQRMKGDLQVLEVECKLRLQRLPKQLLHTSIYTLKMGRPADHPSAA